jgi:hypothetical protein
LRSKLSRRCPLLTLSTGITTSISPLAITAIASAATPTERLALTLALTTHHATRRSVGSLLLDVGGRNNLSGKMEPFTEVV